MQENWPRLVLGKGIQITRLTAFLAALATIAGCTKPEAAQSSAPPAIEPAKAALLATLPTVYQHADLDNGEAQVATCRSCHVLVKGGGNAVGPNLYGVFGRKAGSLAGFRYSPGLMATGIVWDAASLDRWITNPRAVVPGTKMAYAGLETAKDRVDLIAYLKVKTSE